MKPMDDDIRNICARFRKIEWALDERMRRLFAATEASALGRGGVTAVSKATGISRRAIHVGLEELKAEQLPVENQEKRIRKAGAGRKSVIETESGVLVALEQLLEPTTKSDAESPLKWTCKSLRVLSAELSRHGFKVSYPKVSDLLKQLGYSLRAPRTRLDGTDHPDRNALFASINDAATKCLAAGEPVISIDIKKKEQSGVRQNKSMTRGVAEEQDYVRIYGSPDKEHGAANSDTPFNAASDTEWACVGTDQDTVSFAVETIRRWWQTIGTHRYPKASKLMITAYCRGGNESRKKHWKEELQKFSDDILLPIDVSHLPPGTSKWNKIEQSLFSCSSMTCRGQSSISHEVVIDLIAGPTTTNGLSALDKAEMDVSVMECQTASIAPEAFQGEWYYRIEP